MMEKIELSVDLDTGKYLVWMTFPGKIHVEFTANEELTLIEATALVDDEARIKGGADKTVSQNEIDKMKVSAKKYLEFFNKLISKNLVENISVLELYFYDNEHLALEKWKSYNNFDNHIGIRSPNYLTIYERLIKSDSTITIDEYENIKETDMIEITNILPSKFIKRSLGE